MNGWVCGYGAARFENSHVLVARKRLFPTWWTSDRLYMLACLLVCVRLKLASGSYVEYGAARILLAATYQQGCMVFLVTNAKGILKTEHQCQFATKHILSNVAVKMSLTECQPCYIGPRKSQFVDHCHDLYQASTWAVIQCMNNPKICRQHLKWHFWHVYGRDICVSTAKISKHWDDTKVNLS